jgi:D-alanyl-D-alanine carboxypeptidase/D-alanyl-D-alanine-endopeptidase (penicillin-binding protein 4)
MSKGNYAWGLSYVVTDVPEYNRSLFKNLLARMDVDVYGMVTFGSAQSGLGMIGVHNSDPLRELIHDMLKKSDNIIAGALFKKLGQLYTRQQGSGETGNVAVTQILSRYANVNTSGMRILDGSGLSPDNLATASQMMQVLDYAIHTPKITDDFISDLHIGGIDGTLSSSSASHVLLISVMLFSRK